MTRTTLTGTAAIALLTAAALWSGAAEPADTEAAARGRVTYRVYCSNCHGDKGTGDGELAELLTVQPADLTRITERYDGEFPKDWLARKIDGREPVRGHGMQEMPVWGLTFRDRDRPSSQESQVANKIGELVAYLSTIQQAPSSDQGR